MVVILNLFVTHGFGGSMGMEEIYTVRIMFDLICAKYFFVNNVWKVADRNIFLEPAGGNSDYIYTPHFYPNSEKENEACKREALHFNDTNRNNKKNVFLKSDFPLRKVRL